MIVCVVISGHSRPKVDHAIEICPSCAQSSVIHRFRRARTIWHQHPDAHGMHQRQAIPTALRRLAALQDGVISREQAIGHGFGESAIRRVVRQGVWRRISPGIYLTATLEQIPWPALAWAGVLIGGDAARVGGIAAAHLHGLVPEPPSRLQILVRASGAVPKVTGPWDFRRERPAARLPTTGGSPPRLSIEDTVLDLIDDPECDARAGNQLGDDGRPSPSDHSTAHSACGRGPTLSAQPRAAGFAAA